MIKIKVKVRQSKEIIADDKKYKGEWGFWKDDIEKAKREYEKIYNKQVRDSERTIRTGKIVTEEENNVKDKLELIQTVIETSSALELRNVNNYVRKNGDSMSVSVLSRLSRTPVMRSIEYLLENRTDRFDVAWKIFTDDGQHGI